MNARSTRSVCSCAIIEALKSGGERNPKVLVKLGHWHIFYGQGPNRLQIVGNFVTELMTTNESGTFNVPVYLRGPWRDVIWQKGMAPIIMATQPASWSIIDFSALRPAVRAGQFGELNSALMSHICGFDAALVMGGATQGTERFLTKTGR